jgi:hypothetical protein
LGSILCDCTVLSSGHNWQHWLIGAIRVFLHPEVRAYDKGHGSGALQWIVR